MKHWMSLVGFCASVLLGLLVFQNCGAPSLPLEEAGQKSVTPSGDETTEEFGEFISTSTTDSSSEPPFAKANGSEGDVSISADQNVIWEWRLRAPVRRGFHGVYGCPNSAYNKTGDFIWANGSTQGRIMGTSADAGRAGCSQAVCFYSTEESRCVTVHFTPPSSYYAKANRMSGVVARRADEPTLWQFKLASPVVKGRTRTSECNDPSMNSAETEFDWGNGQTEYEYLGSSSDYRRDGCRQTVCFDSATDSQCVTAVYHMQGGQYFAAANGDTGVVKVQAKHKTVWSFNVESPVTKGTSQMSNCTTPSLNTDATEFKWANGLTSMTLEGSSEAASRVGCRQEVCFHTSDKKYCVTAIYE